MLFYGIYNGYGKNREKVTSGSDPALVSEDWTLVSSLSASPQCDFEDSLQFLALTPLNTSVPPNWGWPKPPQRLENSAAFFILWNGIKKPQTTLIKVLQSMGLAGWDSPPIPGTAGMELWVSAPALSHSGAGAPGAVRDHIQCPMKSRGSASKPGNTFLKAETSFVNT